VEFNVNQRKEATTSFQKDYFKLVVNVIFGKSVEDKFKYRDVHLISQWKPDGKKNTAERLIARPSFHSISIFSENLVAIELNKTKVKLDKPTFIGIVVLDNSKHFMASFFYDVLYEKYGTRLSLCYTGE